MKKILLALFSLVLVIILAFLFYLYFPSPPKPILNEYENWNEGAVKHILSNFDHEQLLLKVSTKTAFEKPIKLLLNEREIIATAADPKRRFWQFHAKNLKSDTTYSLQLFDNEDQSISDPWQIKTFPAPSASPEKLTIMTYTCAGGVEESFAGKEIFIDIKIRQELFKRGLSYNPDLVIANGDHIYWDQQSLQLSKLRSLLGIRLEQKYGKLDLTKPMLGEENYETFTKIADIQIADLYGCYFRGVPIYFLPDDHDLFENDEATEQLVTFPPKDYMMDGAQSTQQLYYPEFLANAAKPKTFPDVHPFSEDLGTSFGIIQYGNLAEFNLYDCKRFSDLKGEQAKVIPQDVENWLEERIDSSQAKWLFHVPSSPFGWTAGKWQEWYPDVLNENGELTITEEKYLWQSGWWKQHQRILAMLSNQKERIPLLLQGDLHIANAGRIDKSGGLDFHENPIYAIGTGPIGSSEMGYASSFRGIGAQVPKNMTVEELMKPIEKNGFTIIELDKEKAIIKVFAWRAPQKVAEIANMEPVFELVLER